LERSTLISHLDVHFNVSSIRDASCNGLQIEGKPNVTKAALAVDFSLEAVRRAEKEHCDLLIVHHGLIWGGLTHIRGFIHDRIKAVMNAGLNLYALHLPLDMHAELGHNVQIARLLGLEGCEAFGSYNGQELGVWGSLPGPVTADELKEQIDCALGTASLILPFGRKDIRSMAVISGSGSRGIADAIEKDCDAFFTGETSHTVYHTARDAAINVFFGGHYATETPGLKALGRYLEEKFDLPCVFLDIPTGL
jgi:dinuclear metal center YbgI/SA1388 family protein